MSHVDTAPAASTPRAAEGRRPRRVKSQRAKSEARLGWLLAGPAFFVMLFVVLYPILQALYDSLFKYRLTAPGDREFVGLGNYGVILTDPVFWKGLGVTLLITVVTVVVELILGFLLALDDVGAGDNGLRLLAKVRPDFIKLDRSVVVDATSGGPGRALLAAVLACASLAGARVIAEGIETPEMLQLVHTAHQHHGCAAITGGQGCLLGRVAADLPSHAAAAPWHVPAARAPLAAPVTA